MYLQLQRDIIARNKYFIKSTMKNEIYYHYLLLIHELIEVVNLGGSPGLSESLLRKKTKDVTLQILFNPF